VVSKEQQAQLSDDLLLGVDHLFSNATINGYALAIDKVTTWFTQEDTRACYILRSPNTPREVKGVILGS
jgi:hypothetical protein